MFKIGVGSKYSEAPETHPTVCNSFYILKAASCEPYMRVNFTNEVRWEYHNWDFGTETDWECQRGISIYEHIQLHLTDAQTQWRRCQSWLHEGDTVVSCTAQLVWVWLHKGFQSTIHCWYTAKYLESPSFTLWALSWRTIFPVCITNGISFEWNSCAQCVQKYQIIHTERYIKSIQHFNLWMVILCTNWRRLQIRN